MNIFHFGLFDIESYGDLLYSAITQRRINAQPDWHYHAIAPTGENPRVDSSIKSKGIKALLDHPKRIDACIIGGGNIIQCNPSTLRPHLTSSSTRQLAHSDLWIGASNLTNQTIIWNSPCVTEAFPLALETLARKALKKSTYISVCDETSKQHLLKASPESTIHIIPDICWEASTLYSHDALTTAYNEFLANHPKKKKLSCLT